MIRVMFIRNFQSHKDTKLEFSSGVNTIVGQSRSGKTSIIRALRWLTENRPSGDEFKRHGSKGPTSVSITLGSGDVITRVKSNSENFYKLNDEKFSGFGTDVPMPVRESLNITDINIQQQFDTPFLLFDSPGHVARYLNSLVNLEKIDFALSNISSMKRQNEQDIRQWQTRVNELDDVVKSFPDLESAEGFIAELEQMERLATEKHSRLSLLTAIQSHLNRLRRVLFQVPDSVMHKVSGLIEKHSHLTKLEYTKKLLIELQDKLSMIFTTKESLQVVLNRSQTIDTLLKLRKSLDSRKKLLSMIRQVEGHRLKLRRTLKTMASEMKVDMARFSEMMPEICPLCEQEIK